MDYVQNLQLFGYLGKTKSNYVYVYVFFDSIIF